ncbi:unnamed protein product [Notodromas monacha]|uniref:Uncharacterized protein n=1 Tax=Notodromas monacha TaxID=399045 RepID=A0A7R9C0A0_9CRUS|nr:unnamed protein product [Notodromas monacha]CAG0925068.1 unnamed protein product [Notodromas monacha]
MEDMQVMYRYLTTGLFPSAGRAHEAAGYLGPALAAPKGFFMTGPSDLSNADNLGKIPRVIVRDIGKGPDFPPEEDPGGKYGEEHQLIVYRAKDTTICFLFEDWFPVKYPECWYDSVTYEARFFTLAAILDGKIIGFIIAEVKSPYALNKV